MSSHNNYEYVGYYEGFDIVCDPNPGDFCNPTEACKRYGAITKFCFPDIPVKYKNVWEVKEEIDRVKNI